ncbi:type II toxin-antitoxin system VapC family toxin [Thermococcus thioreducens]|uniref:PIN domain-containing protein n=1 Tax=Thermococcus thioreducens TaxID=277988 RepID=A0A0Q2M0M4_9EURY|nr:type II toxin-antitoxin system VapC family toxin [Thermococcus thioreducens]ASJ13109.1 hypothetical protein A3L14_09515 [Thermococcus thioreducens]KQH81617.1 hypothetical protein AMR53_10390 [Thermococcus thioreducens]SEV81020.1 hypothetical protein SAMN05216170_0035 [Thermococcus thioreducens]
MLVVDTSALIDATIPVRGKEKRNELARGVISAAESRGVPMIIPRLGVVEAVSLVKRLTGRDEVVDVILSYIDAKMLQVSEDWIFEDAKGIARSIHPRAADSYFIATAKKFSAILVSSDRDMVIRAKKLGIKAFYILDQKDVEEFYKELFGGV